MDEGQVKAAVLMRVREANGRRRKPIVTAELTLGSSGVRADLVVFAETSIGFEIKTARDTLRRLPTQMEAYARYCRGRRRALPPSKHGARDSRAVSIQSGS